MLRFSGQALAGDPFKEKTEVRFQAFGNVLMIPGVGERLLQVQDGQMEGLSPAVPLLSPASSTWPVGEHAGSSSPLLLLRNKLGAE